MIWDKINIAVTLTCFQLLRLIFLTVITIILLNVLAFEWLTGAHLYIAKLNFTLSKFITCSVLHASHDHTPSL